MQVFVTSTHLGIVMEYAAGGELFDRIVKAGRFSEDEARYFFQQLISGVEYCHSEVQPHSMCTHAASPGPATRPAATQRSEVLLWGQDSGGSCWASSGLVEPAGSHKGQQPYNRNPAAVCRECATAT